MLPLKRRWGSLLEKRKIALILVRVRIGPFLNAEIVSSNLLG